MGRDPELQKYCLHACSHLGMQWQPQLTAMINECAVRVAEQSSSGRGRKLSKIIKNNNVKNDVPIAFTFSI